MGYELLALALTALAGYLLGSINWSIILTWLFKDREDIREFGSGNAGMTNVLRTVGKKLRCSHLRETFSNVWWRCCYPRLLWRCWLRSPWSFMG